MGISAGSGGLKYALPNRNASQSTQNAAAASAGGSASASAYGANRRYAGLKKQLQFQAVDSERDRQFKGSEAERDRRFKYASARQEQGHQSSLQANQQKATAGLQTSAQGHATTMQTAASTQETAMQASAQWHATGLQGTQIAATRGENTANRANDRVMQGGRLAADASEGALDRSATGLQGALNRTATRTNQTSSQNFQHGENRARMRFDNQQQLDEQKYKTEASETEEGNLVRANRAVTVAPGEAPTLEATNIVELQRQARLSGVRQGEPYRAADGTMRRLP